MKKILSFKLFEKVYLDEINPFSKEKKHVTGLRFSNKEEAIKSVKMVQEMLDQKKIELADAIIASYIMSKRAENHKYQKQGIREGGLIWKEYLLNLRKKESL